MNDNQKRSWDIIWQSTMKAAVDLIPEEKKGTDEGFKLYEKYHSAIFKKYIEFNSNLNK
jgi:hypothetical protein